MDHVVTAPDMLAPRENLLCDRKTLSIWAVVEDWSVDEEAGHNEILYADKKDAARVFHSQLSVEANEGCIERWKGRSHFQSDQGDLFYECWLDGDYLCVEFTNTTEKTLFGVICAATVSDANGQILDMMMQSPYDTDDLGIAQGSSIVWRKRLEDAATLKIGTDAVCKAWAYRMEDL